MTEEYEKLFQELASQRKAEELAKSFMSNADIVERVTSLKAIAKVRKDKQATRILDQILKGKFTKGIPLLTCYRFWRKNANQFGKRLNYGSTTITTAEIDSAFTRILEETYLAFVLLVGVK